MIRTLTARLLALGAVFVAAACADPSGSAAPAAPPTGAVAIAPGATGNLLGLDAVSLLQCSAHPASAAQGLIGPQGGTLSAGGHTLTVPAGALRQWTTISMNVPAGSTVEVRFAPHGLRFERRAELSLSYAGCRRVLPLGGLFTVYLGLDGSVLEFPSSTDVRSELRVRTSIDHFSRYAVAW